MAANTQAMGSATGSLFSDIGGAIQAFGAAQGAKSAAGLYDYAGDRAKEEAQATLYAGQIKDTLAERQAAGVIGAQQAAVAGSGFAESGSALDLLRESRINAAIQQGAINWQTNQQYNGFIAQESMDRMQASAARTAASNDMIGGYLDSVSAVVDVAMIAAAA